MLSAWAVAANSKKIRNRRRTRLRIMASSLKDVPAVLSPTLCRRSDSREGFDGDAGGGLQKQQSHLRNRNNASTVLCPPELIVECSPGQSIANTGERR